VLFPQVIGVFLVLAISLPVQIFNLPDAPECMLRDRDEVFLRSPERKEALEKAQLAFRPQDEAILGQDPYFLQKQFIHAHGGIAERSISVLFSVAISLHLSQTRSQ
jgi:hypothetical protein